MKGGKKVFENVPFKQKVRKQKTVVILNIRDTIYQIIIYKSFNEFEISIKFYL